MVGMGRPSVLAIHSVLTSARAAWDIQKVTRRFSDAGRPSSIAGPFSRKVLPSDHSVSGVVRWVTLGDIG